METQKKRRGDRKDGRLMRELDSLHYVTGILYPCLLYTSPSPRDTR